jgi:HK97 family phage major capsid protein
MEVKELIEKLTEQNAALSKMDQNIAGIKELQDKVELRIKELENMVTPRKVSVPGMEPEKFSLIRAINAIKSGDWSNAGYELEVFNETKKKTAMSAGTDTVGGYIVPAEALGDIIELLRAELVVASMGATMLTGLVGNPVEIPKVTGGSTAYWVAENSAITESNLTVGQLALSPKAVAAMVKLSNRLLRLSNPSVEAMIRSDIATVLALAIDLAALRGSGANGEPIGIANTTGINTVEIGTDGGAPTFDVLSDMQYELQLDNAFRGNLGYIFHPRTRKTLLQTKVAQYTGDTGGEYIIQPIVSDAQLQAWLGYKYGQTTQVPIDLTKGSGTALTEIYFANWKELIVGSWGGMEIMASKETSDAFEKNQTWVRIIQDVDIAVRHAESFCLVNDAT